MPAREVTRHDDGLGRLASFLGERGLSLCVTDRKIVELAAKRDQGSPAYLAFKDCHYFVYVGLRSEGRAVGWMIDEQKKGRKPPIWLTAQAGKFAAGMIACFTAADYVRAVEFKLAFGE